MKELLFGAVVVVILYFIGSFSNPRNEKDYRFGIFTNVMYGLITVLAISVVLGVLNYIFRKLTHF
jgi:tetrahydromethanopterin S-methyltransferase subunit B